MTRTHALLAGSPALDVGSNPDGLTNDQRGLAREFGPIDIGAFEEQPIEIPFLPPWGLALLAMVTAGVGWFVLRRAG